MIARFLSKEVDNHISIIHQRPATTTILYPFNAQRADILLYTQRLQKIILDGFGLSFVVHGRNHKIIGD